MKKIILGLLLFAALPSFAQPLVPLKKTLELNMPKTAEDDKCGTRGASVAWHPVQKKYYAVFAGNIAYPLAVFNMSGKRLSGDDQTAMLDTRGLWFDPATKKITGNGYDEGGWFTYKTDAAGLVTDLEVVAEGLIQPDPQSVGTYNPTAKKVMFFKGSRLYTYTKAGVSDSTVIHTGRKKIDGPSDMEDPDASPEDYNYTSLIYTGIKGQEIGLLNTTNKEIELYDIKTGYLTKRLGLPENATAEASFNFAYANGTYWLFDMTKRVWKGYK